MKKIFSALVLLLVLTTSAYAEHEKQNYNSQKPVSCMNMEQMLAIVDGKFGEKPWFRADGISAATDGKQFIQTQMIVAVNLKTKTFSIVEVISPQIVCIIGSGNNFTFNEPPKQKTNIAWEH